jgi:putative transposase
MARQGYDVELRRYNGQGWRATFYPAEAGTPVGEICRKLGISEQTFYRWKKRFGALGVTELRELRQLRDENRKLKGLVADLTLDKTILHEALRKKW